MSTRKPLALTSTIALALSTQTIAEEKLGNELLDQQEEIVIYGEKQDKSLQETPVSVGVITSEDLSNSTISDFNDIYNRLANVSVTRGGNESLFAIRGINIEGLAQNPNNFTAGVYVDDVALDNTSIRYGAMNIWDAEQVEVYRGPQGTLQGRSALTGAMYVKTADPSYEWSGKAQATYGNYNTKRHSIAGGGAIIDDKLAFRIAADDNRSDSYVENITRKEDDYSGFIRQMVRGKLLFEPTENFDALLSLSHSKNNIGDTAFTRNDAPFGFKSVSDANAYHNSQTNAGSLKLTYNVNENISVTSISSFANDQIIRADDLDTSAEAWGTNKSTTNSESLGQELRVNFDFDKISGVAGLYYNNIERTLDQKIDPIYPKEQFDDAALEGVKGLLVAQTVPVLMDQGLSLEDATAAAEASFDEGGSQRALLEGTFAGIWTAIPENVAAYQTTKGNYEIENMAIFGETTFEATEQLYFTVGARFEQENQKRDSTTIATSLTQAIQGHPAEAEGNMLLAQLGQILSGAEKVDTDYQAFLPKFAAQYFFTENMNTAFVIQRGYRAGGSSLNGFNGQVYEYDPEYTWNYELAFRGEFEYLNVAANVFYTDWEDMHLSVYPDEQNNTNTYVDNVGKSNLYGAEIELTSQVTEEIQLFSSLGYVHTEFDTFFLLKEDEISDYSGNEFPRAPSLTVAVGVDYQMENGLFAGVDGNYQNSTYLNNENDQEAEGRTIFNAKVGYQHDHGSAYLWVTNLSNEHYVIDGYESNTEYLPAGQDKTIPGAPRMFGITMNVEF